MFLELYSPPIASEDVLVSVFERVPGTQNPPAISNEEFIKMRELLGI
jgi:hypothetical protein